MKDEEVPQLEESQTPTLVVHYYLPMPIIEKWLRSQKGNFQMVKFNTTVTQDMLNRGFTTPTKENVDTELVNQFKTMGVKDALLIPRDTSMTERSLKVQVGKAAKLAGRTLEWATIDEGYVARVKLINNNGSSENGEVAASEAPTEEATTSRNRR